MSEAEADSGAVAESGAESEGLWNWLFGCNPCAKAKARLLKQRREAMKRRRLMLIRRRAAKRR